MGCTRDINRILWVLLVVGVVLLGFVSPPGNLKVFAASNIIMVTFDPDGNVSLDVYPNTQAFGTVYIGFSNYTTANTKFTLYNNGTGPVDTTAEVTGTAANMVLQDYAGVYGSNTYGLRILQGTATNSTWIVSSEYRILSNDTTGGGGTATFGMQLMTGPTMSSNWTTQFLNITILGVPG